jgi:hypothetical protein
VVAVVAGLVNFVVVMFMVKALWAWTIPDLFPGAIEQRLVPASISWWTAVKIAIFAAVLSGFVSAMRDIFQKLKRPR